MTAHKFIVGVGWGMIGFGCFTLVVVLSPRHAGWPLSLMLVGTGWSMVHRRTALPPRDIEGPVALRPLGSVLKLHLICLACWGAGLGMRLAEWGYLPSVGVQKGVLCFGMALCLTAAHELAYTWRLVQVGLLFAVLAVVFPSIYNPSWYQLPAQESTPVQLGIAGLAVLYLALLLARRWVR